MMISALEDRLYTIFFYVMVVGGVIGMGWWIHFLSKRAAKNKPNK
ncbi:hypothetical protein [Paenibacillus beijingensis]|nr:hypothetical protein [Paenibacillus beijingensis]